LVLFAVGIGYLSHTWGDPWYGTLSAVSGVICVVLVAEGRISNYAWGLVNCVLYGLVSYQNKFYGDMSLNWFMYVPFQFIGFYIWHKSMNLSDDGELEVKVLSPRELLIGALLVCWMTFVLGVGLDHFGGEVTRFGGGKFAHQAGEGVFGQAVLTGNFQVVSDAHDLHLGMS
jgi:nicotinamide mononucleotide transporter